MVHGNLNTGNAKLPRRRAGRFFGRRVNCEYVPTLPAGAVRWVLDDPRKIPYLFAWKSKLYDEINEAVRVAQCGDPGPFYGTNREVFCFRGRYLSCSWLTVKRTTGKVRFSALSGSRCREIMPVICCSTVPGAKHSDASFAAGRREGRTRIARNNRSGYVANVQG